MGTTFFFIIGLISSLKPRKEILSSMIPLMLYKSYPLGCFLQVFFSFSLCFISTLNPTETVVVMKDKTNKLGLTVFSDTHWFILNNSFSSPSIFSPLHMWNQTWCGPVTGGVNLTWAETDNVPCVLDRQMALYMHTTMHALTHAFTKIRNVLKELRTSIHMHTCTRRHRGR